MSIPVDCQIPVLSRSWAANSVPTGPFFSYFVSRFLRVARATERQGAKIKVTTARSVRADAKMTPEAPVASYRELINLLKYLLYLFIIRARRCGPELSRASKQLPLNSSCNGHAECAGVQSDFISLRGSDRAYITCTYLRRLSRAVPSLFPGYGSRGRSLVFALFPPPSEPRIQRFLRVARAEQRISSALVAAPEVETPERVSRGAFLSSD